MADSDPPKRPRPQPAAGGGPLPRLWKIEPETEAAAPEKTKKSARDSEKKKAAKAKAKKAEDDEQVSVDTYDKRSRDRLLVSSALIGLCIVGLFTLYLRFRTVEERFDDLPDEAAPIPVRVGKAAAVDLKAEGEATNMLDQARQVAGVGKPEMAASMLGKIVKAYPGTTAARAARGSLDQAAKGLPLFAEKGALIAERVEPDSAEKSPAVVEPPTPPEPPKVVVHPLPPGFRAVEGAPIDAEGWPASILCDRDGSTMVFIPRGEFVMGRDEGPAQEQPAHRVRLSAFYIDRHEVTNRQYQIYAAPHDKLASPSRSARAGESSGDPAADLPVVAITARQAHDFAAWAGKMLPTEAQWEKAARTADGRIHPWGPGAGPWDKPKETRDVAPVMTEPGDQSPFGVFDLAGNAWEWTADYYDPRAYKALPAGPVVDPTGAPFSRARPPQMTVRGGSKLWVSSWREGMKADARARYLGFRCVLQVEGAARPDRSISPETQGPAGAPVGVVPF
ncbi:SUMF1/EgtB/PvdO family nonheme iron enzyme [Isosphaeraceae bacterium EP7]